MSDKTGGLLAGLVLIATVVVTGLIDEPANAAELGSHRVTQTNGGL